MSALLRFLRENLWWWLAPILIAIALIVFLAWKLAQTPTTTFTYEL